ncbi:MAG: radical SAM protein [Melioribacteraceae bacterium]
MRTSEYTIYTQIPNSDQYILLHSYTGAVDLVTSNVVEFLKDQEKNSESKTKNLVSDTTKKALIQRGYLTEMSVNQERERVKQIAEVLHRVGLKKKPNGFLFIPAYDCNFRCPYCVESWFTKGENWPRKRMTKEQVDLAYEAIEKIEPEDKSKRYKRHNLYGGEPLMAENFEIVKYIVDKGIERGNTFHAVTNAFDLEVFESLLGKGKIEALQITIDGPPGIHNKRRTHRDGIETFDKIADNISLALNKGVSVSVRMNIDKTNFDKIGVLAEIFETKGWTKYENFKSHVAAVHHMKESDEYLITSEENRFCGSDPENLFSRGKFAEEWIKEKYNREDLRKIGDNDGGLVNTFKSIFKNGSTFPFRSVFCSVGSGMYIFDPEGDIYSCWDTVGIKETCLGKYFPKLEFNEEILNRWQNRHIGNTPKCSECKYALFCGGGCEAFVYHKHGTLSESHCDGFPIGLKNYILLAYEQYLKEKETCNQILQKIDS